jgi:RHS repeat-associated protein
LYDDTGSIIGLQDNGETYYFVKNLQGDVIGILDSAGEAVGYYFYDVWGNIAKVYKNSNWDQVSDPEHIALRNPFRYRGYMYDEESGLYYLQSRYYDPVIGRFVNADGFVSTGQGLMGNNMFAYCGNNPVMRVDIVGMSWSSVKNFFKGIGDGISGFFTDTYKAVKDIPNKVSSAAKDPLKALGEYAKTAIINTIDPFGGGRKIYNFSKAIISGDVYSAGKVVGGHIAESGTAVATYSIGTVAGKAVDKIMPKIVKGPIFSMRNGWGIKIGSTAKPQIGKIDMFYRNPAVDGGTIFSFNNSEGISKFRLDWDPAHGFHMHPPGHK